MSNNISKVITVIASVTQLSVDSIDDFDRPLIEYGLDSLDLSSIYLSLEDEYSVTIEEDAWENLLTINQIARYFAGRKINL